MKFTSLDYLGSWELIYLSVYFGHSPLNTEMGRKMKITAFKMGTENTWPRHMQCPVTSQ